MPFGNQRSVKPLLVSRLMKKEVAMIRAIATICILAAGTTAAFAGTQQGSAARQPAGIQMAASSQSDPNDANAKMTKKPMKKHHMSKSGATDGKMSGGMADNWFGNDGMKKDKSADNDWFGKPNAGMNETGMKKGKMKKSADTSNDWFANWNNDGAKKTGMK